MPIRSYLSQKGAPDYDSVYSIEISAAEHNLVEGTVYLNPTQADAWFEHYQENHLEALKNGEMDKLSLTVQEPVVTRRHVKDEGGAIREVITCKATFSDINAGEPINALDHMQALGLIASTDTINHWQPREHDDIAPYVPPKGPGHRGAEGRGPLPPAGKKFLLQDTQDRPESAPQPQENFIGFNATGIETEKVFGLLYVHNGEEAAHTLHRNADKYDDYTIRFQKISPLLNQENACVEFTIARDDRDPIRQKDVQRILNEMNLVPKDATWQVTEDGTFAARPAVKLLTGEVQSDPQQAREAAHSDRLKRERATAVKDQESGQWESYGHIADSPASAAQFHMPQNEKEKISGAITFRYDAEKNCTPKKILSRLRREITDNRWKISMGGDFITPYSREAGFRILFEAQEGENHKPEEILDLLRKANLTEGADRWHKIEMDPPPAVKHYGFLR